MSDWLTIVILAVIEGITEFLPISSTGHLLLAQQWLARQSDLFNVVIQSGAVIAVIPLFPERVRQVFRAHKDPEARDFVVKAFAAFFITGVGGLALEAGGFELPETPLPIILALIIGGILFLVVENWLKGRKTSTEITWTIVVLVGVGQLIAAVFPGASRSGSTILIMLALGMSRVAATEFSFLVGIPTMLAAGSLKIVRALVSPPPDASPENWGLLALGTLVSAIVSFIAVKWLLGFVQTHTFKGFGWYRIVFGIVLAVLFMS